MGKKKKDGGPGKATAAASAASAASATSRRQQDEAANMLAILSSDGAVDVNDAGLTRIKMTVRPTAAPAHVTAQIEAVLPQQYPEKQPAQIKVKADGLTDELQSQLEKKLQHTCQEALPDEALFVVYNLAQEFLNQHNVPVAASAYDQMLERQRNPNRSDELKDDQRRLRALEDASRERTRLLGEQRQDLIRDALSRRAEAASSSAPASSVDLHENLEGLVRGQRIGFGRLNSSIYEGIYHSRLVVAKIYRIVAPPSARPESRAMAPSRVSKHLEPLETEAAKLASLSHDHLVRHILMTHKLSEDAVTIFLIKEYCGGGTLASRIAEAGLPLHDVRNSARGLLSGLAYLQDHGIVHGDVRPASVLFDSHGRVKWTNFCLHARLEGVLQALNRAVRGRPRSGRSNEEAELANGVEEPEALASKVSSTTSTTPSKSCSRERDIHAFGFLVLEMAIGQVLMAGLHFKADGSPIPPEALDAACFAFVQQCLSVSDSSSSSSGGGSSASGKGSAQATKSLMQALTQSSFLCAPELRSVVPDLQAYQSAVAIQPRADVFPAAGPTNHLVAQGGLALPAATSAIVPAAAGQPSPLAAANRLYSRYRIDFEELEYLGSGGFGAVVKARNRLDTKIYAIKIIKLDPHKLVYNRKIVREVTLLSGINHPYVVRYFQAWIEAGQGQTMWNAKSGQSRLDVSSSLYEREEEDEEDEEEHDDGDEDGSVSTSDNGHKRARKPPAAAARHHDDDDDDDSDDLEHLRYEPPHSFSGDVIFEDEEGEGQDVHEDDDAEDDETSTEEDTEETDTEPPTPRTHSSPRQAKKGPKSPKSPKSPKLNATKKKPPQPSLPSTAPEFLHLYMQMEFCPGQSLRRLLGESLQNDMALRQKLLRQLLEALAHVHMLKIVHRDIKPDNIFLDDQCNVKLGDFGLATLTSPHQTSDASAVGGATDETHASHDAPQSQPPHPHHKSHPPHSSSALSSNVGTSLYLAPEIMLGKSYDSKVDMYSLGITLFEMAYAFGSMHERFEVLTQLRKADVEFPDDLRLESDRFTPIIKQLLQHNPADRPSAAQLLESGVVDSKSEEESLREALKAIRHRGTSTYTRVLKELFKTTRTQAEDLLYDEIDPLQPEFLLRRKHVRDQLSRVFQTRGAVEFETAALLPVSELFEDAPGRQLVKLLDVSGSLVQLPSDLKTPFARYVARAGLTDFRRYVFGRIFRVEGGLEFGLAPKEIAVAHFDIVAPSASSLLASALVMEATQCGLLSCGVAAEELTLHLGHTAVLSALLSHAASKVSAGDYARLQNALLLSQPTRGKHLVEPQRRYSSLLQELQGVTLPDSLLQSFQALLGNRHSDLNVVLKAISLASAAANRSAGGEPARASQQLAQARQDLDSVVQLLRAMHTPVAVLFDLGLVPHDAAYSGVVFRLVGSLKSRKLGAELLAAGGQYTELVRRFQPPGAPSLDLAVVGSEITLRYVEERSTGLLAREMSSSGADHDKEAGVKLRGAAAAGGGGGATAANPHSDWSTAVLRAQHEVAIVSAVRRANATLQHFQLELAHKFWALGLRTLLPSDAASGQMLWHDSRAPSCLVQVRDTSPKSQLVRLKLGGLVMDDVAVTDVTGRVLAFLRQQRAVAGGGRGEGEGLDDGGVGAGEAHHGADLASGGASAAAGSGGGGVSAAAAASAASAGSASAMSAVTLPTTAATTATSAPGTEADYFLIADKGRAFSLIANRVQVNVVTDPTLQLPTSRKRKMKDNATTQIWPLLSSLLGLGDKAQVLAFAVEVSNAAFHTFASLVKVEGGLLKAVDLSGVKCDAAHKRILEALASQLRDVFTGRNTKAGEVPTVLLLVNLGTAADVVLKACH